jgi:selenide,water dikinase
MAPAGVVEEAVRWMTTLNATAAELMVACDATAATDVTGFGLIGHAWEMARGAGVTFRLQRHAVPVMAGLRELVADGLVPAGCYRNRDFYGRYVDGAAASSDECLPMFDPQTSGGLLVSLPAEGAGRFLQLAAARGCFAVRIGEVLALRESPVEIV